MQFIIAIISKAADKIKELIIPTDSTPKVSDSMLNEEIQSFKEDFKNDIDGQFLKNSPEVFLIENIPKSWREINSENLDPNIQS